MTDSLTRNTLPDAPAVWDGSGPIPDGFRGAIAAIGNFDGVHLGHRALLAAAAGMAGAAASDRGGRVAVVTFEPHPRTVFKPEEPVFRLTTAQMRRELCGELGVANLAELAFTRAFAGQSAESFITDVLIGQLDLAGVVTGEDFAFGRGRQGNTQLLADIMARHGRRASTVPSVTTADGVAVSSTRIRQALEAGDIALANKLLGHRWRIRAVVHHGDKRGRLLGFPTANMILPADNRLRHGIYAVRIAIDGQWRDAVASFGRRPTFDDGAPRLETFVFDYAGDLYGRELAVEFVAWVRGEEKFDDVAALVTQMQADSAFARACLAEI